MRDVLHQFRLNESNFFSGLPWWTPQERYEGDPDEGWAEVKWKTPGSCDPFAGSRYEGTVRCRECGIYYDRELIVHDHTAKKLVHEARPAPSYERKKRKRGGPKPKVILPWEEEEEDEVHALIEASTRGVRRPSRRVMRATLEAAMLKDRVEEMQKTMTSVEIMQLLWAELVPHGRRALYIFTSVQATPDT